MISVHRSKQDWIAQFVCGRRVLDLGCVDHELDRPGRPWLHAFIREHAQSVVGVDYVADQVEKMRQRGYHVICADVQTMDLGQKFEVIVAGDILEHLSNPGMFFSRAADHLESNGLLLVTTPNPINPVRLLIILSRGLCPANKQHTAWYTSHVLSHLARRYGFVPAEEAYVDDIVLGFRMFPKISDTGGWPHRFTRQVWGFCAGLSWRLWICLGSLLYRMRPRTAPTLCMAFKKQ